MRIVPIVAALALAGCATQSGPIVAGGKKIPFVTYYDFNHDGRADFEYHERPLWKGTKGSRWAREDWDFDGYYDRIIYYGATISVSRDIHVRVPKADFGDAPQWTPASTPNQAMQQTAR